MKYIDADKLIAEIDSIWRHYIESDEYDNGFNDALDKVKDFIISLKLEQPETNLEKEVENFCLEYDSRKEAWFNLTPRDKKMLSTPTWSNFAANIARHFYEIGFNTGKK